MFRTELTALAAGAAVGFLSGLFGVGGGVFAIVALVFAGMTQQLAQGTGSVMILPNAVLALWLYGRRGSMDPLRATIMGLCSIPSTCLAARAATQLSASSLRRWFAVFLIATATYAIWNAFRSTRNERVFTLTPAAAGGVGLIAGACSGFFGVGGGAIATPTLAIVFGLPQALAQAMTLAIVLPSAAVGLFTYARAHFVDWPIGIVLAIGGALTVPCGVAVAHVLPERTLRVLFAAALYVIALLMLFRR